MLNCFWLLAVRVVTVAEWPLGIFSRLTIDVPYKSGACWLHLILGFSKWGLLQAGKALRRIVNWAHLRMRIAICLNCLKSWIFDIEGKINPVSVQVAIDQFSTIGKIPILQAEWERSTCRVPYKTGIAAWSARIKCGYWPAVSPVLEHVGWGSFRC